MSEIDFKTLSAEMSGREGSRNSLIMFMIALFLVVSLVWAHYTELDNVTRGEGRVISALQNQHVQAAEGGVILRRMISENATVEAGDILFEIDPVDASSELNRLRQRQAGLEIKELRLRAEISQTEPVLTDALEAAAPTVANSEISLYYARRNELTGAINTLQQRLLQREQDLASARAGVRTAEDTIGLLTQEITLIEPLVAQNIAPETRLLELRRNLTGATGNHESAIAGVAQAESAIQEIQSEISNRQEEYTRSAMAELATVVAELSEIREVLPSLEERVGRTTIRAPVSGIISRLNFRTPGAFVNRGDIMVEIVPTGTDLIIEGRIAPQDISRIRPEDKVRIRFSAYDSTRYGTVDGLVTEISPDAIRDESTGEDYYMIDVSIEGTLTLESGQSVQFLPGMTATLDVLSGKRSVLEYLWAPVAKIQELALRD